MKTFLFILVMIIPLFLIVRQNLRKSREDEGLKSTIYKSLLEGKTPEQIIPELHAIIERIGGKERSDNDWLNYVELVRRRAESKGKLKKKT